MAGILFIVPDIPIRDLVNAIHRDRATLGIGNYEYKAFRDPGHDSSVYRNALIIGRAEKEENEYALAIYDHHGSNCPMRVEKCEQKVKGRLSRVPFERGKHNCVAIDPEFEKWILSDLEELARVLEISIEDLREYLISAREANPQDLEKQVRSILHQRNRTISPKLEIRDIPQRVDLTKWLADNQFRRLIEQLQKWFP